MQRRASISLASLVLLAACEQREPLSEPGRAISPLVEGRSFQASARPQGPQFVSGRVLAGSDVYAQVVALIESGCAAAIGNRFDQSVAHALPGAVGPLSDDCGYFGAPGQQIALCTVTDQRSRDARALGACHLGGAAVSRAQP